MSYQQGHYQSVCGIGDLHFPHAGDPYHAKWLADGRGYHVGVVRM